MGGCRLPTGERILERDKKFIKTHFFFFIACGFYLKLLETTEVGMRIDVYVIQQTTLEKQLYGMNVCWNSNEVSDLLL